MNGRKDFEKTDSNNKNNAEIMIDDRIKAKINDFISRLNRQEMARAKSIIDCDMKLYAILNTLNKEELSYFLSALPQEEDIIKNKIPVYRPGAIKEKSNALILLLALFIFSIAIGLFIIKYLPQH